MATLDAHINELCSSQPGIHARLLLQRINNKVISYDSSFYIALVTQCVYTSFGHSDSDSVPQFLVALSQSKLLLRRGREKLPSHCY